MNSLSDLYIRLNLLKPCQMRSEAFKTFSFSSLQDNFSQQCPAAKRKQGGRVGYVLIDCLWLIE